jgi:hypothetical protein
VFIDLVCKFTSFEKKCKFDLLEGEGELLFMGFAKRVKSINNTYICQPKSLWSSYIENTILQFDVYNGCKIVFVVYDEQSNFGEKFEYY